MCVGRAGAGRALLIFISDRAAAVAEFARDGRPLLVALTDRGEVAAALVDIGDQLTVAAGRPIGAVPATAVLVRPDGYMAWAWSPPGPDQLRELPSVLTHWFRI
ncbi:hypothetical protein AB4305_21810 [Nocardia sp. 2YAB30]|uniref:aromatic-ring hydroxylase C-terminal domain-containing protein n=1 Tax=Nocardia sp. 2YAB30 TaxID=3233022 RepID=UPI003F97341A